MSKLPALFICYLLFFTVQACKDQPKEQTQEEENAITQTPESTIAPNFIFVGTYTKKEAHVDGKAEGIYLFEMNPESGDLRMAGINRDIVNPSFLTISPDKKHLYAVNETTPADGPSGSISAFEIEPENLSLGFLNQRSSHAFAPCHVNIDEKGACLVVANYLGGTIAVYKRNEEGFLSEATDIKKLEGSGTPAEQDASHPHSAVFSPDNRFVFVPDKGTDKIMIFELDHDNGKLEPAEPAYTSVQKGAGPRHFTFHPQGHFAYVINELDASINAFQYDYTTGRLTEIQQIPTIPGDYQGFNACADIHISPDGKFLYGSNRGHDSIAVYAIDEQSGQLSLVEYESVQGIFPRNFMIDRSGTFLYAANQNTDNIVAFRINRENGELDPTGFKISCPTPVCMVQW